MIKIENNIVSSDAGKIVHRLGSEAYFRRAIALPEDKPEHFEEVDSTPEEPTRGSIELAEKTEEKVRSMVFARAVPSVINTFGLSTEEALSVIDLHPAWEVGIDVTPPDRYRDNGKLWECLKPHKTQDNWRPSLNTSSLWKLVKVNADGGDPAGTIDDPIPYEPPMEIIEGLYYIQSNVKYKCTRSSGQPLTHNLSELVGIYVELIS